MRPIFFSRFWYGAAGPRPPFWAVCRKGVPFFFFMHDWRTAQRTARRTANPPRRPRTAEERRGGQLLLAVVLLPILLGVALLCVLV